jgi:uncharacterized protein (TIGR02186 family)
MRRTALRRLGCRATAAVLLLLGAAAGARVVAQQPAPPPESAAAEGKACEVRGDSILADLSTHTVTVDAKFAGTSLLVFGAIDCPGDVVITIRGPRRQMVVREKMKFAGIWVNGRSVTFFEAPVLYALAATAPLDRILPATVRQARSIGLDELPMPADSSDPEDLARFRSAMIDYQQKRLLYTDDPAPIEFIGGKLFHASFWFPASVPTGQYIADVYLIHDDAVIGAHSMALSVYRGGFEAKVFDFAHDDPALYGAAAVFLAAFVGWGVGTLFRRP